MSLVDAIPRTIQQIGSARGRGAAAGKAVWGQTIGDLGKLAANIPNAMRQERMDARQDKLDALRTEEATIRMDAARRDAAADTALQNAMSVAVAADGTIDQGKLSAALAGSPAASKLPDILTRLQQMQTSAMNLRTATINADEAERDSLGALAHAASVVEDANDRAGILVSGLASGMKLGTVRGARGQELTRQILDDNGQPDPAKIDALIKQLTEGSKEQRQLASTEAQREAAAESAAALKAQREEAAQKTRIENAARQLGGANSRQMYERIYRGLSKEVQTAFDAPEVWDEGSAKRAGDKLLTPDQIADNKRADEAAAALERDRSIRRNQGERRIAIAQQNADKKKSGGDPDDEDAYSTEAKRGYDAFVKNYLQRHPAERREEVKNETTDEVSVKIMPVKDAVPPPSIEKWYAMTPQERQAVLANPNARINDTELSRRQGGGAAPAAAAPAAAKAIETKKVTRDQLQKLASKQKMSLAEAEAWAKREGYTVE